MSLKNAAGGVLLIAGTTIGAAVIVLPVDTAHLGFNLATLYFITCWFFMTVGALYVLEANLQIGYGANLISMAKPTLGKPGQIITWIMYLLLLYSLTAAYLTGAGAWVAKGLATFSEASTDTMIPIGACLVAIGMTGFLILGTHTIDLINRVLMTVLFAAVFTVFFIAIGHTKASLLFEQPSLFDLKPLPLIVTGFGFAIIVPTLTEYLHGKDRQLKRVILIGSLFPIVLYLLWEMVILGLIPQTTLLDMQQSGHPAIDLPLAISQVTHHPQLTMATSIFSIFALATSILGVTLSLFDFLADGLKIKKTPRDKLVLSAVTFIPPLFFVSIYPDAFAHVLRFAGIYVCVILGVLPALMVYVGRYKKQFDHHQIVWGGKPMLFVTLLFFCATIIVEIAHLCGMTLII